jgi:hypothetical protein
MRRLLTAVLVCAALAGCSSTATTDTGAPASSSTAAPVGTTSKALGTTSGTAAPSGDGYCATVKAINEKTSKNPSHDADGKTATQAEIDEVLGDVRTARDAGPDELADSWNVLLDALTALADLDTDDVSGAMEIVLDPAYEKAVTKVTEYTERECGFGLEGIDPKSSGSNESPNGTTVGGTGDLPEVCQRLTGLSEDDKTDPLSLYAARTSICRSHPDASWLAWIVARSAWSSQNKVEWAVTVPDDQDTTPTVSADDALEACIALDDYLESVGTQATITIGTGPMDELPKAKTVLVTKATPDGTCTKV